MGDGWARKKRKLGHQTKKENLRITRHLGKEITKRPENITKRPSGAPRPPTIARKEKN